ncbi:copper resistance protein CopC [Niallia oryzisoli]|uniref:Copper resistance protein CopC n=1 Tax=Niallia oryzisoli TaxID=1737571 RepID=A0ABZ2C911_9BACI
MKKTSFLTLIFFLLFVHNAMAHTGLESSFPQDGAVLKEEVQNITLTFESKIEQGSTFELVNSEGASIAVENIALAENQIEGNLSKPLENEDYKVNWSIIGADGHPIDGVVSFTVDVPAKDTPVEEKDETIEKKETTEQAQSPAPVEENKQGTEQDNNSSYLVPVLIGILAIIIVISFAFMMKRKK